MVNWIFVLVGVFLLVIIFMKVEHGGKKLKLILLLLFVAFIYFSASSVLNKNGLEIDSFAGFGKAVSLYFSWLGNVGSNLWHAGGDIRHAVGNAVKTNSSEDDWKINIRK